MAQTSPFGDELAEALGLTREQPAPAPAPAAEIEPEPEPAPAPVLEPLELPEIERPSLLAGIASRKVEKPAYLDTPAPAAPAVVDEAPLVRANMESAGIPLSIVDAVVAEVEDVLRPFEPHTSYRELARRALGRHIQVEHGWRSKRRTIALLGLEGSGKTLTTAKLAHAYARAGRSVTALSLEPARRAAELGELTEGAGVDLEIADSPEKVALTRKGLRADVVLVDTPSLIDPVDGRRLAPLLRMLEALKPDETLLLVPANLDGAEARAFMASLLRHTTPSRLVVTYADARVHTGVPVALSLTEKIPLSYVAEGDRPVGGVTLAEPDVLAKMVLA
jgi:flagellar biosynthesis GTPase FlhF